LSAILCWLFIRIECAAASAASARLVAGQNVPEVLGDTNSAFPRLCLRNYKALTNL